MRPAAWLGCILCLTGSLPTAAVAAKEKSDKKSAPKPVEAGRVYTQADLERVIEEAKAAPTTPLPAAEPPAKPTVVPVPPKPAKPAQDEALSFGNDDLERMYGKPESGPESDAPKAEEGSAPGLADPLTEIADWQAQQAAAKLASARADSRVKELEAQVRDLEQREAAVRNPLLPRPDAPPGLEAGWDKLSGTERVAAIQGRLADLRDQLAGARRERARAEAAAQAAGAGRSPVQGE